MVDLADLRVWLAGGAAALLTGLAKNGVPGLGVLAVPVMAMAMPAKASVGTLLPILIAGDIAALALYRRHAQVWQVIRLLPWVIVGMVPAFVLLGRLTDAHVRPLLGVLVLAMLGLELLRQRLAWDRLPHHPVFVAVVGLLAGFATTMGNAAGPIMNIYLIARGLSKEAFVGTAAWYFFVVNLSKVPIFAYRGMITRESLALDVALLPLVWAGAGAGYLFLSRMRPRFFTAVVFTLTALAAVYLLW